MAERTGIEWTDATWNPIVGCSIVSKGCTNCYAMNVAGARTAHTDKYRGLTEGSKRQPVWTGEVRFWEKALIDPLRWREPRRVFVNSMGDLFHEAIPDEWIDRVFAVMALSPQHSFQVLTKRPQRMRQYLTTADDARLGLPKGEGERRDHITVEAFEINGALSAGKPLKAFTDEECIINPGRWPLPNVWLGTSCEDQATADERIPLLLGTPAAIRFVSAEPLLGPIDLTDLTQKMRVGEHVFDALSCDVPPEDDEWGGACLDWLIVGGESGPHARPMHPDWARSLRDQCQAADVPFFFKQWGEWHQYYDRDKDDPDWRRADVVKQATPHGQWLNLAGGQGFHGERVIRMKRVGKKAAGALLDGRAWHQFPEAAA